MFVQLSDFLLTLYEVIIGLIRRMRLKPNVDEGVI